MSKRTFTINILPEYYEAVGDDSDSDGDGDRASDYEKWIPKYDVTEEERINNYIYANKEMLKDLMKQGYSVSIKNYMSESESESESKSESESEKECDDNIKNNKNNKDDEKLPT